MAALSPRNSSNHPGWAILPANGMGDTLVVETAGFNDKTWLDLSGHPHSEALRIAERYHRRDFGHMDVEMTFDDPQMYTKPFTIKFTDELRADFRYLRILLRRKRKGQRPHRKELNSQIDIQEAKWKPSFQIC